MVTEEDFKWLEISKDLERRGFGIVQGKDAVLAKIREIEDKNPISHTKRIGVTADD